ncbi:MAG: hypothetical protein JW915_21375 [Chitinispirillaceae bacterium]|nr:hypothetical protein [Chitinispirillaceae bacterium]
MKKLFFWQNRPIPVSDLLGNSSPDNRSNLISICLSIVQIFRFAVPTSV